MEKTKMEKKVKYNDLSFWLKVVVFYNFIGLSILAIWIALILLGIIITIMV